MTCHHHVEKILLILIIQGSSFIETGSLQIFDSLSKEAIGCIQELARRLVLVATI
jgi:hypothetical protein